MLNQIIFVGRILNTYTNTEDPIIDVKTANAEQKTIIAPVVLSKAMLDNLVSLYKGDVESLKDTFIGVKGTLETIDDRLLIRCNKLTVLNRSKLDPTEGGDADVIE